MILEKGGIKFRGLAKYLLTVALIFPFLGGVSWAQVLASITGTAKDASGAAISDATVNVKDLETGVVRTVQTDTNGSFAVPAIPVGNYEVDVEKSGFKQAVRSGVTLVVGQQAVLDFTLEVGNVQQTVTVTAEAPIVNTTTSSTSGLVSEQEVKDLPLNGRSFDQLLTLNTGTANFSTQRSTSQPGNLFSVAGRRPEENLFTMNGVEYVGASGGSNTSTPNGSAGQVLGVDAVREFNVLGNTYGAEYGKRAGGHITVVTNSGTNTLHGVLFEYLRNSVFDARNFFDNPIGERIPPFKRNQFGGALGGPIKKDKLFLFGTYEALRLRLGVSDVATVPDNAIRAGNNPGTTTPVTGLVRAMLPFVDNFWPAPNGPELLTAGGAASGMATDSANPLESIREDYGLVRADYNISSKDSFSANYMIQDGANDTPSANPIFISDITLRSELLALQETHIFSTAFLNVMTAGYSRADFFNETVPINGLPASLSFVTGEPVGTIAISASTSGGGGSVTTGGGQGPAFAIRNYFTWADDLHYIKGRHSLSAGVWVERTENNTDGTNTYKSGSVSFASLTTLLTDTPTTFQTETNPQGLGFRSTEAAWYVQDEIKVKPNLTVRLGVRDEMTSGWNATDNQCSNYAYSQTGVVLTTPIVGPSCLQSNNAIALWQPRVGIAWDPTGTGTWAIRAGAGIYNDLQDNLSQKTVANYPFNSRSTFSGPLLNVIPLAGGTAAPPNCSPTQAAPCSTFSPGGVDPNMRTPTVEEWSLTVQRAITKNMSIQFDYVGSQAYHLLLAVNNNEAAPQICTSAAGCLAGGTSSSTGLANTGAKTEVVPTGTLYMPPAARPNTFVSSGTAWFYEGTSSYHAGSVSLIQRSTHGLTFKANYTFSKILDILSAPDTATGGNEPGVVYDWLDLKLNKGPAAFNLTHQANVNFSYELPFGRGQRWGSEASGPLNQLIGGWQWNGILTVQSGFPYTPVVGSNISGTGDTGNPDVPNLVPGVAVNQGTLSHWFNPSAFSLPLSGTFGDAGRNQFVGPNLVEMDTSFFKQFPINERVRMQFRAEFFNIANHANFGEPNRTLFTGSAPSSSAGLISSTATTSRQIQFALRLMF